MRRSAVLWILVGLVACAPAPRDDDTDAGAGGEAGSGVTCSSDLHDVLDANGELVQTCGPEQGCSDGACIDACAAAAGSNGSVGCDFVVPTPSFVPTIASPCFAVFLANNWPSATAVTISRDGQSFDASTYGRTPGATPDVSAWAPIPATGIPAGDVGVVFLSADPASINLTPLTCPVTPAVSQPGGSAVYAGSPGASGMGTAFHITTSRPVSAYDIQPFGGAKSYLPSAELLLPTSAWGTSYVTAGPQVSRDQNWGQVTAARDGTTVTITPTKDLPAGPGVAAAPAGQPQTYHLDADQYIQWENSGDMAGSIIEASAPVAFVGGSTYICLATRTSTGGGCDTGHQQIPPVSALASEYAVAPYATRRLDLQEESILYRFVGVADGTALTYSNAFGGPATLRQGEVVEVEATGPFVVTSQDAQHPFYLAQYMSGAFVTGGSRPGADFDPLGGNALGDEEYVNVMPPAQWLRSYVFFTDPSYTTTNLVLVREADASGAFQDVTVDCLGTIGGWRAVGDGQRYQTTNVDLQRLTPVGSCTNGRHTATSTAPFTVTVWGLAIQASYAYPAGGNVARINTVVIE